MNNKRKLPVLIFVISVFSIILGMTINYYTPGRVATVVIATEGAKNENSLGNNVRISLIDADRETENEDVPDFDEITLTGDWNVDEENHLLTCYNVEERSEAVFQLRDAKKLSIDFISEIGSGNADVYINGELRESIDLYSESQWSTVTKNYDLTYFKSDVFRWSSIFFIVAGIGGILIVAGANCRYIIAMIKRPKMMKIKAALNGGIFTVAAFVIVFTCLKIPLYEIIYDENAVLTISASGEKEKRALGNNVRITDIIVNGISYDLSEIELGEGWDYDGINHMIYAYGITEMTSVNIPLSNVRTIEIVYVKEVGSGIFDVDVDERNVFTINAYENCKWDSDSVTYKVSPLIYAYSSYGTMAVIFVASFIMCYVLYGRNKKTEGILNFFKNININLALSLVIYMFIAFIQRESFTDAFVWMGENWEGFAEGFVILALVNIILTMIFNKNYRSFVTLSVVFTVLLTISYFKIQFRDTPLLPWDFTLAGVAISVASRFRFVPSAMYIFMVLLFAVCVFLIVKNFKKREKNVKISLVKRVGVTVFSALLLVIFFKTEILNTQANLFEAKEYYLENGFVTAFCESMRYLVPVEEPADYSEEKMNEIYSNIKELGEQDNGTRPDVIVLMSESFWDITRVEELEFEEEIFPTYRKLQETSMTGELLTNVYNGGTVNSEFEMLTGFSTAYLPSEYVPYQRCIRPGFFSVNSFLESKGYESLAIHPFEKSNYNRNTAYEYFGFDKTLWEEDFDEDAERMRGYISDHALTEKIISEYEKHKASSDAPWFNVSVSMQNHGGYWESSLDKDKAIDIDDSSFSENSRGSIEDLATGLHYADIALGELIEYFETVDDPVVIVMFGDHMSNAGPIGETLFEQSSLLKDSTDVSGHGRDVNLENENDILEQRRVPFMAWSNFKSEKKDCGIMSVTGLLPAVFDEYGVPMPEYFTYLNSNLQIYSACASNIFIDSEGNCKFVSEMNEEEKALYDDNKLIEYDYVFGENYMAELFDY